MPTQGATVKILDDGFTELDGLGEEEEKEDALQEGESDQEELMEEECVEGELQYTPPAFFCIFLFAFLPFLHSFLFIFLLR